MSCIIRQESIATAHCYFKLFFTTSGNGNSIPIHSPLQAVISFFSFAFLQ